jgi:hypothetical protein
LGRLHRLSDQRLDPPLASQFLTQFDIDKDAVRTQAADDITLFVYPVLLERGSANVGQFQASIAGLH